MAIFYNTGVSLPEPDKLFCHLNSGENFPLPVVGHLYV